MAEDEGFNDLIRRVRQGEREAAAELVRRYEPAIRRVVRVHLPDPRLRRVLDSPAVCQSVVASFFVRATRGKYNLDTRNPLLQLLASIARNKVTTQANRHQAECRDYRREQALGAGEALVPAVTADPAQQVADRDLLE